MMGTTVWVSASTRNELRLRQQALGTSSADETIARLLAQPAPDALALFSRYRAPIRRILDRHQLRNLVAFGSRARGDARVDSDLDLAADIAPGADPLSSLAAEADLEELLGVRVRIAARSNPIVREACKREGVAFEG